jgi:hypothetical protein
MFVVKYFRIRCEDNKPSKFFNEEVPLLHQPMQQIVSGFEVKISNDKILENLCNTRNSLTVPFL